MLPYRIYLLDDAGHIRLAHDIECGSDTAAMERAAQLAPGAKAEVWSGARLVGRHPPAVAAPTADGVLRARP